MYIAGMPGTGKTATVHECIASLHEEVRNHECTDGTWGSVLPCIRVCDIACVHFEYSVLVSRRLVRFLASVMSRLMACEFQHPTMHILYFGELSQVKYYTL